MYIESINLQNFRNIESLSLKLNPGVNVFYGDNGSGKTNLLEALFVLCLGRSHRAAAESVMIREGCDFYRLEGQISVDGSSLMLAVAYQVGARKKVTIDKVTIRLPELYRNFALVAVGPEDSSILSGSPAVRRNFLDIYLSQHSDRYLANLSAYQKALNQKNAALKKKMDPDPFNALLTDAGAAIMKQRREYLADLGKMSASYYKQISDGGTFELEYKPSVRISKDTENVQQIAEVYRRSLEANAERERIMETSLIGVHRDDIHFMINWLPARSHGSQGEWRTAAVSLKLAVYHLLKQTRGFHPVLLLDEIFAELDRGRSEALMLAFKDFKQLFLTTADQPPDFLREGSRSYRIADGRVTEIT